MDDDRAEQMSAAEKAHELMNNTSVTVRMTAYEAMATVYALHKWVHSIPEEHSENEESELAAFVGALETMGSALANNEMVSAVMRETEHFWGSRKDDN